VPDGQRLHGRQHARFKPSVIVTRRRARETKRGNDRNRRFRVDGRILPGMTPLAFPPKPRARTDASRRVPRV